MNAFSDRILREADHIVALYGKACDAADLESLAAGLLNALDVYEQGPEFGRQVAAELQRRAKDLRQAQLRSLPDSGAVRSEHPWDL